jgi:hypothetical protein
MHGEQTSCIQTVATYFLLQNEDREIDDSIKEVRRDQVSSGNGPHLPHHAPSSTARTIIWYPPQDWAHPKNHGSCRLTWPSANKSAWHILIVLPLLLHSSMRP